MVAPIDTSTTCSLLADPTRRQVLTLFRARRVWPVEDLAAEIAARRGSNDPDAVSPETVQRTQIELVHNHVPRLADYGVLEWDGRSGDIVRSDRYDDLELVDELPLSRDDQPVLAASDDR